MSLELSFEFEGGNDNTFKVQTLLGLILKSLRAKISSGHAARSQKSAQCPAKHLEIWGWLVFYLDRICKSCRQTSPTKPCHCSTKMSLAFMSRQLGSTRPEPTFLPHPNVRASLLEVNHALSHGEWMNPGQSFYQGCRTQEAKHFLLTKLPLGLGRVPMPQPQGMQQWNISSSSSLCAEAEMGSFHV